jgi:glycosyltransferase involved in cell wall biosynthesis
MKLPLVSILIPCYNAERWIAETVASALGQTWRNKEIIVVDDGSIDSTRSILKSLLPQGIKVIEQENRGAGVARNRALSEAQGEVIQFLDADDLLAPDKIEIQMKRLSAEPPDRVASGAWGRFYDVPNNTRFLPELVWTDLAPVDWLVTSWCGGGMMATHSWLTPRTIIAKAGKWDETPSPVDDGEFFTRVVLNSSQVLFCPEARSYYRSGIHGSWSKGRTPEMLSAAYRSIEASTSYLIGIEDSPRTRKACAAHFQQFVFDVYPDMPELVSRAEVRVASLGGSDHKLGSGGTVFWLIAKLLGWKHAKRIQVLKRRLRRR